MPSERLSLRQRWLLHYMGKSNTGIVHDMNLRWGDDSPCGGMYEGEMRRFLKPLYERGFIESHRPGFIELSLKSEDWLKENPTEVGWADLNPKQAAELKARQEEQIREDTDSRPIRDSYDKEDIMTYISAPVAKDPAKKRIEVHVMPELKEALVKLAKADKRSLLNYIEFTLEQHVKERGRTNRPK